MTFIVGLLLGIYIGGGLVTNVVVGKTIDGRPPTLLEKISMRPYVLWTAGEPDEP